MLNKCKEPVLLGGDFNIIINSSEKNKGGVHRHTNLFNSIINTFDLIDISITGGRYTWSNNQENPTLERLDRYLASKSWEDLFPLCLVYKLPRELSDHNPVIITINSQQKLKS
jgi:exonuclease III